MLKTVEYMCFQFKDEHVPHFMETLLRIVRGSNVTRRPLKLRLNYTDAIRWPDTEERIVYHHFEPVREFWNGMQHLFSALDSQQFDWVMILHGITCTKESVPLWMERISAMRDVHGYLAATKWARKSYGHDSLVDVLIGNTNLQTVQESWIMNCSKCTSYNDEVKFKL